ncbi:MAG: hypothetical protein KGM44_06900, partial [bacterium]|nr:hypothetical protein [bacterium]
GAGCIRPLEADLSQPWPPQLEGADRILLDAPCSGLGILGRAPEARWRKRPDDAARLAPLQRRLLTGALQALAPGGRLVYAVCSTDPLEGEEVVTAALADAPATLVLQPPPHLTESVAGPGLLIPPGIGGRDGFFMAALGRPG